MAELFHITERVAWLEAIPAGEYRMSTRGITLADQGFIHCSHHHQVSAVAEFVYGDVDDNDLVVLVIDVKQVSAPIRDEAVEPGGPEYPHIYGVLPVDAVTDVLAISRDTEGRLVLPADPRP